MTQDIPEMPLPAPTSFEVQIEALGGEPLAGSGFEGEEPEPGFVNLRQNPGQA